MGLPASYLPLVKAVIEGTERPEHGRLSALALGYPDLLATREQLIQLFGTRIEGSLLACADSDHIKRVHRAAEKLPAIFDTIAFFDGLGVTLKCIDFRPSRGVEEQIDLNEAFPPSLIGKFDFVFDFGTLEHCFNVSQAFVNAASALVEGGCVIHASPLNMFNHGFYNFSPTLYPDFYEDNGFTMLYLGGLTGPGLDHTHFDLPAFAPFADAPVGTLVVAVARRTRMQPVRWPIQRKYRSHPSLIA